VQKPAAAVVPIGRSARAKEAITPVVELASGDAEEAAGLADVMGDFRVMLENPEGGPGAGPATFP
jgi:hypothetical protein